MSARLTQRLPYQPSPHGFSKSVPPRDSHYSGLLIVAYRDALGQWWAKAPEYSPDYLAVGGTAQEAFQNIRKVLDAENGERQNNPGPTQSAGELTRSLKF